MRWCIMLTIVYIAAADSLAASLITNGGFDANGAVSNIKTVPPQGWTVNIPSKFGGDIRNDWHTDGSFSLRLRTMEYQSFTAGSYASVSQQVDLSGVNFLFFDLNLRGQDIFMIPWDPAKVTAFVKVDSNDVWSSDANSNGVLDVNVPIAGYTGKHNLTLGIKTKASGYIYPSYWAQWDSVKFDTLCGGFGLYEADLNRDCYVDMKDLALLGDNWLRIDLTPSEDYLDLQYDYTINLLDFAVLADQWMLCTNWQDANCVSVPLGLSADLNHDGIVNFLDYSILIKSPSFNYNALEDMAAEWLERNWLFKQ